MLSPNQIKMQNFSSAGRGAYKAAEVDMFLQKVYISYNELITENSNLKKKFASLASVIDEYKSEKNAIATAIVKAQALADQTVASANASADEIISSASSKAQALLDEKAVQAEEYEREKKQQAEEYYAKAKAEYQRVMAEAEAQSVKYVEEINARAEQIIADANEKASRIVSAAIKDAKEYRLKADEIIAKAKVEVETTKNSVAFFKDNTISVLSQLVPLLEQIELDEFVEPELEKIEAESENAPEEIKAPKFEFDNIFEKSQSESEEADEAIADEIPEETEFLQEGAKFIPDIDNYVNDGFEEMDIPASGDDEETVIDEAESFDEAVEEPASETEEIKPAVEEITVPEGGYKFRVPKKFDIFDD